MTISYILRKLESPKVGGEGSTAAVGSTNSSVVGSPEEGGWDATPEEDSTRGHLELAFIWAAFCLRKVAPIGAIMCTGSDARKSFKPKYNKIWCMKIEKKRLCDVELLLWTSTNDQMERVGKLIEALVTRAYKNAHLSIGIVCKWEMGQIEWQEIQKNK